MLIINHLSHVNVNQFNLVISTKYVLISPNLENLTSIKSFLNLHVLEKLENVIQ